MLAEHSLQGDQLRQKDAVQALGRLRSETECHFAAAVVRDQPAQLGSDLINLRFVEPPLLQLHAEDLPSMLDLEVVEGWAHGLALAELQRRRRRDRPDSQLYTVAGPDTK